MSHTSNQCAITKSLYTLAEKTGDGAGILCNTFTGAIDKVSSEVVDFVNGNETAERIPEFVSKNFLVSRGYYVEDFQNEALFVRRYAELKKEQSRRRAQPKYMFAVTLRCNLACSYCWQVQEHRKSRQSTSTMSKKMVDSAFEFIDADLKRHDRNDAFISMFGGEPLLDTPVHHELLHHVGRKCVENGYQLHLTTNGRQLEKFDAEIAAFKPSIQITVDGFIQTDRPLLFRASQKLPNLYQEIYEIVQTYDIPIFLRFLVNENSIEQFSDLADQIYRNDKLAGKLHLAVAPIQNKSHLNLEGVSSKFAVLDKLLNAIGDREYSSLISYVDWRSLNIFHNLRAGSDTLPDAVFHHCEANVNLTCFDYDGNVYACYEGIGNPEHVVGKYHPDVKLDADHLARYRDRTAFTMKQCSNCSLSPICGGGCEVRAQKKNGSYETPFCDGLHSEMSQVLQRWDDVKTMLMEGASDAEFES